MLCGKESTEDVSANAFLAVRVKIGGMLKKARGRQ